MIPGYRDDNNKGNKMIRTFKIALAVFIALFCLTYAAQNLMNLQAAHGFVGLMTSMADHVAYPNHIGPPIKSPAVVWVLLFVIIAAELLAGLLGGKGVWDMWKARGAQMPIRSIIPKPTRWPPAVSQSCCGSVFSPLWAGRTSKCGKRHGRRNAAHACEHVFNPVRCVLPDLRAEGQASSRRWVPTQ